LLLADKAMFDDNTAIKLVLALLAAIAWALQIVLIARRRRAQPDLSFPVDTWSTQKFGIWWIGRGLFVLVIFVTGIGFALVGKGSASGAWVLFCFSAAVPIGEFIRRM
jgi:drug/metabolite transporter (DMT)-like permease